VDNPVDNAGKTGELSRRQFGGEDIHRVIYGFLERFPPFFDGKRYKLINFAPK